MQPKKTNILIMPKPKQPEPEAWQPFAIRIGEQRLSFDIKMTSEEIRDGELVVIDEHEAKFCLERQGAKPKRKKKPAKPNSPKRVSE